eukprot:6608-Pyramimonas_sp.AAC.1
MMLAGFCAPPSSVTMRSNDRNRPSTVFSSLYCVDLFLDCSAASNLSCAHLSLNSAFDCRVG